MTYLRAACSTGSVAPNSVTAVRPFTDARVVARRFLTSTVALTSAAVLAAGCAHFDDSQSAPFTPAPGIGAGMGGAPAPQGPPPLDNPQRDPGEQQDPAQPPPAPKRQECADPDPAVIATCLAPTVATAGLPMSAEALIAERDTGQISLVSDSAPAKPYATISPAAGKVIGLALSPDFEQDKLIFALLARPDSTAIVRITEGDKEKLVAEGLPNAPNGQAGIAFDGDMLTVGIGNELLHFPDFTGIGMVGRSEKVAATAGPITSLCTPPAGGPGLFATTGGPTGATVERVDHGAVVRVWSWSDQHNPTACAMTPSSVAVAFPEAERVDMIGLDEKTGGAVGTPAPLAEHKYGRLAGVALMAGNALVATTVNKDGGTPGPTDDRAIILPISGGSTDERT